MEVNIRAGSIDRLVEILGGETLYGPNPLVPVRELLQNAEDALALKRVLATTDIDTVSAEAPIRLGLRTVDRPYLEIIDHGIGMSREIMQEYLVTIVSDFWNSELFHSDFPQAMDRGFRPAGSFGIGFVSIFMIASSVEVSSNRPGGERLLLCLRGLDRRGHLRLLDSAPGSGTTIKVWLRAESLESLTNCPVS